jgi:hypothetical protein
MYQISTNAANQSQQPKHDKQRDDRPQHYSYPPYNFNFHLGYINLGAR